MLNFGYNSMCPGFWVHIISAICGSPLFTDEIQRNFAKTVTIPPDIWSLSGNFSINLSQNTGNRHSTPRDFKFVLKCQNFLSSSGQLDCKQMSACSLRLDLMMKLVEIVCKSDQDRLS